MTALYWFRDGALRAIEAPPAARRLRWAAWRPDNSAAMLVGNGGQALLFDGKRFEPLATGVRHNLRGIAWSPDGKRALLAGNRGTLLLLGGAFQPVRTGTFENLRRVAWSPDGSRALVVGNGGVVLRFDTATGRALPLPGDRAHTMRSVAWRPDGRYALIGASASRYAGYPRPHALYRCDGRYTQALMATDDADDVVAIDWRPGASPAQACILAVARGRDRVSNKLFTYDGSAFGHTTTDSSRAMLGLGWHPDGSYALICGEAGALLRYDGAAITPLASGTADNLIGPFWQPSGMSALLLRGPDEKVYTV